MDTKYCKKCDKTKQVLSFHKDKNKKDGYYLYCKECINAYNRKYSKEKLQTDSLFKQRIKENYKKYSKTEKAKEKSRRNHKNNKEKELKYGKEYYYKNREKRLNNHKNWATKNKEKLNEYSKNRLKDPLENFKNRLKCAIRRSFKNANVSKSNKTFELLNYKPEDLRYYLEKWLNKLCIECNVIELNLKTCHIDHYMPLNTCKSEKDVIELNQLKNLRLICKKCNLIKSGKIPKEFIDVGP